MTDIIDLEDAIRALKERPSMERELTDLRCKDVKRWVVAEALRKLMAQTDCLNALLEDALRLLEDNGRNSKSPDDEPKAD